MYVCSQSTLIYSVSTNEYKQAQNQLEIYIYIYVYTLATCRNFFLSFSYIFNRETRLPSTGADRGRVSRPSAVFTAGRRPFDIHDVATAEADDSRRGCITLLHIPLVLLKYFSSNSHEIRLPHTHTHMRARPSFARVVKVKPTLSAAAMSGARLGESAC